MPFANFPPPRPPSYPCSLRYFAAFQLLAIPVDRCYSPLAIQKGRKEPRASQQVRNQSDLGGKRCALFLFLNLDLRTSSTKQKTQKQKELKEIDRDKASGVTVSLKGGSLKKLTGYVEGESRRNGGKEGEKTEKKADSWVPRVFEESNGTQTPTNETRNSPPNNRPQGHPLRGRFLRRRHRARCGLKRRGRSAAFFSR